MYKMYKKDRGQWVEVANFDSYSKARYYARRIGFVEVDNPDEGSNYYYESDTFKEGTCILKEPLTDEQREGLEQGEDYTDTLGVAICRHCGDLIGINSTNQNYINIDGNYYCDDDCALREDCFYCEDCETWYDSSVESRETGDGRTICQDCLDNNYRCCDRCGEIYRSDDMHYDDYGDCCYCDNCWDEIEDDSIIKQYHSSSRPPLRIQKTEEDKPQDATFGTEIEAECNGECEPTEIAQAVNDIVNRDKDLFVFEEDGSLDNGYETISQPFTMRWFKQNQELFKKMFATMVTMGARSHDTSTCGFHVHIGRHFFGNQEQECIDRLLYILEKYRTQLEVFSRRKSFGWCQFPNVVAHTPIVWSKLDEVKKLNKWDFRGHHSALNLENSNTIEIRIFKGTLNFNTYYATLELVNNLINYVKDKTDSEVEQESFKDILEYLPTEHLKEYCLDRNII